MISSDDDVQCTPPAVLEAAKESEFGLLPEKSRERYMKAFERFMDWRKKAGVISCFSENTVLAYFGQLADKIAPNSLWTQYSMLRTTLAINKNINIANYAKLKAFLKRKSVGYKPTKSNTLTPDEIKKFINEAPDDLYLLQKVILIIGISGACRKQELVNLKMENIENLNSAVLIKIPDTKTHKIRTFTVTGEFYEYYCKYAALRPFNLSHNRFFLNYRNRKCTIQPVGINKIGGTPKLIATYLNLKNPESYTGHCYRRSSATILVDAGGDITALKRHGGWQSTSVAEEYINESVQNKIKVANTIVRSINEASGSTLARPSSSTVPEPVVSTSSCIEIEKSTGNNTMTVSERYVQAQHPVNFYNCNNNNITINVYNSVPQ